MQNPEPENLAEVTALVLAGGRGARMGGVDKGLQPFRGQPLAQHALQRLADQQGGPLHAVLVNANRNASHYLALGEQLMGQGRTQVLADGVADFAGPLAGFQVGLAHCSSRYLLTVPCDSPLFPLDLTLRLLQALQTQNADIAMVRAPEPGPQGAPQLRSQPVFCLMKTEVLESLNRFLAEGGRKIDTWAAQHALVHVAFDTPAESAHAFANANTLEELRSLEQT